MDELNPQKTWTIAEAAEVLDISVAVIRKYCNHGLVSGWQHRFYRRIKFTAKQMDLLKSAHYLSAAGFSMAKIREYNRLKAHGGAKAKERCRAMLATHKRQTWENLHKLQETIDFIERQEDLLK